MSIQNPRQLQNTRRKLRELEELYAEAVQRPVDNADTRELTLRSLKQTMNELKEEIARYQAHATTEKR